MTITGPERWADLALPSGVPVASLIPQVLRVCSPETEGTEPARWALTTVDGAIVTPEETLSGAGVLDGDVLLLRRDLRRERPARIDDVRGAVEDRVDETARIWRPRTTFTFGVLLAAIGPLLVLTAMLFVRPSMVNLAVAPAGMLFSLGGMWVACRRSMWVSAHALLVTAGAWGALSAALPVPVVAEDPAPAVVAVFACVGLLVVAVWGWRINPLALPYLSGLALITVAVGTACAVSLFTDVTQAVRGLALLLAVCVGVLPRIALAMGGLSNLDYEVRHSGSTGTERFEESLRDSDLLLLGAVIGAAVAAAATVPLLAYAGDGLPDLVVAALVGLLLIMRSRFFDRVSHVLPLRLGGVLSLAVVGVAAVTDRLPVLLPWLSGIALVAGVAVAAISWIDLPDVPRASLRRLLNGVEIAVVMGLCVALAWAMGLFGLVATLAG
ncbi:type VII secretion integral membrane protein EccD [Thermobifida halotolerans]|uniref:type VII secretion integral membrane protein EccD n=1 Tax=Thermobifida halotolerans TaxID=483545 RepID=UPI001FB28AB6|nr:type VII secretion integral membrane protein EccD [Thermobifida halotolerans]